MAVHYKAKNPRDICCSNPAMDTSHFTHHIMRKPIQKDSDIKPGHLHVVTPTSYFRKILPHITRLPILKLWWYNEVTKLSDPVNQQIMAFFLQKAEA